MKKIFLIVIIALMMTNVGCSPLPHHKLAATAQLWQTIPSDTIIGETTLHFLHTDTAAIVIIEGESEESTQKVLLTESNFLKIFTFDGAHDLEIWLEKKRICVKETIYKKLSL